MRRRLAMVVTLAACCAALPASARADATTFQLNAAHTGYTPEPLGALKQRWSVDLGMEVSYPLIAEGKVFALVQGVPVSGQPYPVYVLFAFDQATGAVLWKHPITYPGADPSPIAYDDGRVFLATPYDDPAQHTSWGAIEAFDAGTGKRLWRHQTDGSSWVFKGPPVAADGVVYVTGAGFGGWVYAVRQSDGAKVWTTANGDGDPGVTLSSTRGFVPEGCNAWSFNRADGAVVWSFDGGCTGGAERPGVLYGGRLWVRQTGAAGGRVFDAGTGKDLGSLPLDPVWDPPPAFAGRTRVQVNAGAVSAFDVDSGARLWTFAGDGTRASAPLIAGHVVYVGTGAGRVYGIDLASGKEAWRGDAGAPVRPPDQWNNNTMPGLAAGAGLLVVPASGRLVAYGGSSVSPDTGRRRAAVRVRVRCRARCRARIVLKLAHRLARRHDLPGVIGSRRVTLGPGTHSVTVRLRKPAARRLSQAGRVRVTARVSVRSKGATRTYRRALVLGR